MDGTWKSENILGGLDSDMIAIGPFGPAVPPGAIPLVNETKKAFIAGKKNVFAGPIKDNKGAERVKAGQHWSMDNLGKMDWLVEGIIGQAK
jgi:basic membrane protein A